MASVTFLLIVVQIIVGVALMCQCKAPKDIYDPDPINKKLENRD